MTNNRWFNFRLIMGKLFINTEKTNGYITHMHHTKKIISMLEKPGQNNVRSTPESLFRDFTQGSDDITHFLNKTTEDPVIIRRFLELVVSDKNQSLKMIDALMSNPREIIKNSKLIEEKLGRSFLATWLINKEDTGYIAAYRKYIEQMVNNPNTTLDDLLKHRPDWTEDTILKKSMQVSGTENFILGNESILKEFGGKETFEYLIKCLQKKIFILQNNETVDKTIDDQNFTIHKLPQGTSPKFNFLITTNNHKTYVVKVQELEEIESHPKQQQLQTVDSVGLQSVIDYYLTLNNCRNVAPLLYYNHEHNVAIYEYIEKSEDSSTKTKADHTRVLLSERDRMQSIQDLAALNITYTDFRRADNIIIDRHNVARVVDTGHSIYEKTYLTPLLTDLQRPLPMLKSGNHDF